MRSRTVGILGGGQLARMLVLAGVPLGLRFHVLDAAPDACAGQVAPLITAGWDDRDALARLAAAAAVATFDFENVPAASARWLAGHARVQPSAAVLEAAQDRLAEKTLFGRLGLGTAAFAEVGSREGLDAAIASVGTPSILKTRRFGYDGKGQFRLHSPQDADAAWQALAGAPAILEAFVPFEREVSVLGVRGADGDFRAWPLVQNWHVDGVLSASLAPAPGADGLQDQAFAQARTLAEALDYVGVFALELFVQDGSLIANEMAPRVHNSGHWTIEGAACSQFENHLRAVTGLPLGDTACRGPSVMLNWIGQMPDAAAALRVPGVHWHDYGKAPRPGRKVGHATLTAPDGETLAVRLQELAHGLGIGMQVAPVLAALEPG